MNITPITLTGRHVRLEPLAEAHVPDLCRVGLEPSLWRNMLYGDIDSEAKMLGFVQDLLRRQAAGTDLPFTVVELASDAPSAARVSWTSNREQGSRDRRDVVRAGLPAHSGEHGMQVSSLAPRVPGLGVHPGSAQDRPAQRALAARHRADRRVREGVLRNHMIRPDGTPRDSVYYSIIDREWPAVKARLEEMLR